MKTRTTWTPSADSLQLRDKRSPDLTRGSEDGQVYTVRSERDSWNYPSYSQLPFQCHDGSMDVMPSLQHWGTRSETLRSGLCSRQSSSKLKQTSPPRSPP